MLFYYVDPSVGIGSCGFKNKKTEFVAALVSYNFSILINLLN